MKINYFSAFYFIYPCLCAAVFAALMLLFRGKSKTFIFRVLLAILFVNFALHFLKLAFEPYRSGLPASLRKVSFENICAVSTLLFPFFMLSRKAVLLDFMFFLGTLSGLLAMFLPLNIIGLGAFEFESIRFYICHGALWICPLCMVIKGVHRLDYHRVFGVIAVYVCYLCIITLNEVFIMVAGWATAGEAEGTQWEYFLSNAYRNGGWVFGPPPGSEGAAAFILAVVPPFFKPGRFISHYMPVLWQIPPLIIYGTPYALAVYAIFCYSQMKNDFICAVRRADAFLRYRRLAKKRSRFFKARKPRRAKVLNRRL